MLPPGHVAASFLSSYAFLKIAYPGLEPSQTDFLLALGAFFGFAPDLDMFFAFAKEKAFVIRDEEKNSHRKFYTHIPFLWLILALAVYCFSKTEIEKLTGAMIFIGSFSHFLIDSVEHGIMWLWPFSKKVFALKDAGRHYKIEEKNFVAHWLKMLKIYSRSISFYLEIVIIIFALITLFKIFNF
jgi:membrane-bound metal-dependent hydrolase YbcI (DUF457 family)